MNHTAQILKNAKTIAVVGLSPKPERTSHAVAAYMQQQGYRIIPVNPLAAGSSILGEPCYASLCTAADAVCAEGGSIDIVNVFRNSDDVPPVVDDTLSIAKQAQVKALWLQLGITHPLSEKRAQEAGLAVVADKCIKIEHWQSKN